MRRTRRRPPRARTLLYTETPDKPQSGRLVMVRRRERPWLSWTALLARTGHRAMPPHGIARGMYPREVKGEIRLGRLSPVTLPVRRVISSARSTVYRHCGYSRGLGESSRLGHLAPRRHPCPCARAAIRMLRWRGGHRQSAMRSAGSGAKAFALGGVAVWWWVVRPGGLGGHG